MSHEASPEAASEGFNLSAWALRHRAIVLFMLIAIAVAGVFSFNKLGRLEDPNFSVPSMTAVVIWPGATAQQVQDQVLNRMEKKFEQLDHFDTVKTFARQGYGAMTLNVVGGTSKKDQKEAWYQARKKFSDIKLDLPQGVVGPIFNDEYGDVYSLLYAVKADGVALKDLQDEAEVMKRELLRVPGVKKVDVIGKQGERLYVEFSHERLAQLGIPPQAIVESLAKQNAVLPAGSVDTKSDRVFVRVSGELRSVADVRNVPVEAGGRLIKLGDIAEVKAGFEDPATYTVRHNGQPVLMIGVTMVDDGNIIDLGRAMETKIADMQGKLPYGIELERVADQPTTVADSIWEFERSLIEALVIVMAVSFLSLGWRTGLVVAASVPLVLGLVAIVMYMMGWNLERISLGSLIIALGLLVDDAIIAVETMLVKMEEGWDRLKAAGFAYSSTAFPRLTGALITACGFMPVGLSKSITGEYAGGIFWIVGTAVLASWFVAGLFTPYLGVVMLPSNVGGHGHGDPYDKPMYHRFRKLVDLMVARRWWVIAATAGALVTAIWGMGLVQKQFFPMTARPELIVDMRMKEGASFQATEAQVKHLEAILAKDADIKTYTAYTGAGAPRFYLSLSPELPNPGYAQFILMTKDLPARERVREKLTRLFAEDREFPLVRGRVTRLEFGPPVGYPVQFRVIGPDAQQVRRIAREVEGVMRASPLLRDTQLDWNDPVRTLKVDVDQDKARALGLTPADISLTVQTVMNGATVSQVRDGEDLVDVVARAVTGERTKLETLQDINLYTRNQTTVPLSQVATVGYTLEEPVLWRRNRAMAITVRADVIDGVQGATATEALRPALHEIEAKLPSSYRIEIGGAVEESDKANKALFALVPIMVLAMLTFLMLQLQSFSRMVMVFLTGPLGMIGVVPALLVFHAPFGFVALLGVVALAGMIMRNSVILVDQIDKDIAAGAAPWEAIVGATIRRSRPVVLTAAAAVLAMIPLTRSVFWGPMAISIMGGLTVATILTLLFVPALYAAWFKVQRQPAEGAAPLGTPVLAS